MDSYYRYLAFIFSSSVLYHRQEILETIHKDSVEEISKIAKKCAVTAVDMNKYIISSYFASSGRDE